MMNLMNCFQVCSQFLKSLEYKKNKHKAIGKNDYVSMHTVLFRQRHILCHKWKEIDFGENDSSHSEEMINSELSFIASEKSLEL